MVVEELIRTENDGSISFGNYHLPEKKKKEDFAFEGDLYKVKTCAEITRLEKNEMFVFESEPGTTVTHMREDESGMSFVMEGPEDAQVTVQCEGDTAYEIYIDGTMRDTQTSSMGGKLSFSVTLGDRNAEVLIRKHG